MKKKIVSMLLVVALGMGCLACGDTKETPNASASHKQIEESESEVDEKLFQYDVLDDGNIAVWGYDGDIDELVIPEKIDGKTVEVIGSSFDNECGFEGAKIKSVVIPDTVKRINRQSFINSSLEKVDLGNGVEEIYADTFGFSKIKEITIPASLKYIGRGFCCIDTLSKVVFEADVEDIELSFMNLADDLTIYGPANSNVQKYAEYLKCKFVAQ